MALGAMALVVWLMHGHKQISTKFVSEQVGYGFDADWTAVRSLTASTTQEELSRLSNHLLKWRREPDLGNDWIEQIPIRQQILKAFAARAAGLKLITPKKLWSVSPDGWSVYSAGYIKLPYVADDENDSTIKNCDNCFLIQYAGNTEAFSNQEMPGEIVATTSRGFLIHSGARGFGERYDHVVADGNSNIPGGFMGEIEMFSDRMMGDGGPVSILLKNRARAVCIDLKPVSGDWNTEMKPLKLEVSIYRAAEVWGLVAQDTVGCYRSTEPILRQFETSDVFPFDAETLSWKLPVQLFDPESLVSTPQVLKFSAFGVNYAFDGQKLTTTK